MKQSVQNYLIFLNLKYNIILKLNKTEIVNQNKTKQDIGPGQYFPLTEFKFQNLKIVPFGVSTNKKFP
jgi:hypothetical protein